jgi:hypothetical protein
MDVVLAKPKYMRIIFLAFILTFAAYSCCLLPFEKSWTDEYAIENGTNFFITIYYRYETFDDVPEIKLDTIEIMPNSEFLGYKMRGFGTDGTRIFPVTTDSVVIQFDNKKKTVQTCERFFKEECTVERNIVNYWDESNYTKKVIGGECGTKEYRYTYTITEEDYNNAVPIEE